MTFFDISSKEAVLISACLLGIPCRYQWSSSKLRTELIIRLKEKYILIPVCPEQLGGMPTPRTSVYLPKGQTGVDVLDLGLRLLAPETGEDVTDHHIRGGEYALEIAQIVGCQRACMKAGSPSCDKEGIASEILTRRDIKVIRVG